jgi:transcriptional regulator with XRE-family HTH domain
MDDGAGGFGSRLRACRRSCGLSQQELAERSGLSIRAISKLECGRTRWPYPDSVNRLADALKLRDAERAEFTAAAERRLGTGPVPSREGRVCVPRLLPATIPAFVGRASELRALSRMLDEPGGPALITAISGTAGVGKTALAVHWAHQVAQEFPDGQLFVNLRGFGPSGAPLTPADAAGVFLDGLQVSADRIPGTVEARLGLYRSVLAGKRMLIVLDNALDVAQVRPLLPGSPACRVVVTSRNQLPGLTAIEAARPLFVGTLTSAGARQLLVERLGSVRLAADRQATDQIIGSCARLPLALCIVAAHAELRPELPLARIAADLAGQPGLDAFTDMADPVADVRAAFSWSYRQLDRDAARVFRLAGLHPGTDLEPFAVAALAGTTPKMAARTLGVLARASMIQPKGWDRYSMHDLLRAYAREQAAQHSEEERRAALTALFEYYLRTAAAAINSLFPAATGCRRRVPASDGPAPDVSDADQARVWLDAERANLAAAASCAAGDVWSGHAFQLASTTYRYVDIYPHLSGATTVHTGALGAPREAGDRIADAGATARLCFAD